MALDYGLISGAFESTSLFGVHWLFGIAAALIAAILITRDMDDIPILLFMTMLGFHIVGLTISYPVLVLFFFIFIVKSIGFRGMGTVMSTVLPTISELPSRISTKWKQIKTKNVSIPKPDLVNFVKYPLEKPK